MKKIILLFLFFLFENLFENKNHKNIILKSRFTNLNQVSNKYSGFLLHVVKLRKSVFS